MSPPTSYRVKQMPSYRQNGKTITITAKATSKPLVSSPVLHLFCDFFKLASLITGFVGVCIIYFNKQFWQNRRYTLYSITTITIYALVFTASLAAFIQIKRIEFKEFHLLKLAYEKRQSKNGSANESVSKKKQSKSKTKCSRIKK